jgi:hypothetical protein
VQWRNHLEVDGELLLDQTFQTTLQPGSNESLAPQLRVLVEGGTALKEGATYFAAVDDQVGALPTHSTHRGTGRRNDGGVVQGKGTLLSGRIGKRCLHANSSQFPVSAPPQHHAMKVGATYFAGGHSVPPLFSHTHSIPRGGGHL